VCLKECNSTQEVVWLNTEAQFHTCLFSLGFVVRLHLAHSSDYLEWTLFLPSVLGLNYLKLLAMFRSCPCFFFFFFFNFFFF